MNKLSAEMGGRGCGQLERGKLKFRLSYWKNIIEIFEFELGVYRSNGVETDNFYLGKLC